MRPIATCGGHSQFKHPAKPGHIKIACKRSDEIAPKTPRYAVAIEKASDNYSAYAPDLPGCIATGEIVAKLERELSEAIPFHIEGLKEDELAILRRARSRNISRLELGYPSQTQAAEPLKAAAKFFDKLALIALALSDGP